MSNMEVVTPDAISTSGGRTLDSHEPWTLLNPCPNCGARPHDAPESTHADGTPRWNFPHCWKCGHRPGTNMAFDVDAMKREFEEFRAYREAQTRQALAQGVQQGISFPTQQAAGATFP